MLLPRKQYYSRQPQLSTKLQERSVALHLTGNETHLLFHLQKSEDILPSMKKWVTKGDVQRAKIAACVAFVGTLGGVIVIRSTHICDTGS
jgi:hypothetical protein